MLTSLAMLLTACSLPEPSEEQAAPPRIDEAAWQKLVQKREIVSKPYHIDKIYASMFGPSGFDYSTLGDPDEVELMWITGYKTLVVDAKSQDGLSQEFMCHANLDFDAKTYYEHFPKSPPISGRVFTLSQGQQEIHFPPGMGIPVRSDLQLSLATQVLNLNLEKVDLDVRHQVEIEYVRDRDLDAYRAANPGWEVTPLYQTAVQGFKALENARYYGVPHDEADPEELGGGCSVGKSAVEGDVDEDTHGQKFTAHWIVPPGREENRTNVTRFLNLPNDTSRAVRHGKCSESARVLLRRTTRSEGHQAPTASADGAARAGESHATEGGVVVRLATKRRCRPKGARRRAERPGEFTGPAAPPTVPGPPRRAPGDALAEVPRRARASRPRRTTAAREPCATSTRRRAPPDRGSGRPRAGGRSACSPASPPPNHQDDSRGVSSGTGIISGRMPRRAATRSRIWRALSVSGPGRSKAAEPSSGSPTASASASTTSPIQTG
jgi:hypothetical protein